MYEGESDGLFVFVFKLILIRDCNHLITLISQPRWNAIYLIPQWNVRHATVIFNPSTERECERDLFDVWR
jgi:hypothetical protein